MKKCYALASLYLISLEAIKASDERPGWTTWLSDNINEYENVTIGWDDPAKVPSWLYGTYLKNGHGRTEFGGEKRYGNLVDGWAKINKFHVSKDEANFSAKFLKTPLYQKNEAAQELVPQSSLGPIYPGGEPWGIEDFSEISANVLDNTPVVITRMGSEFIASTDVPNVNVFDIATLEWKEFYGPPFTSLYSAAHWMKELGTDNMLNYNIFCVPVLGCELKLYRYPNGNLRQPEWVGKFKLEHQTMIHMFSVTEKYAIFFVYPIHIDVGCVVYPQLLQNLMECTKWKGEKYDTNIVVMSLETGKVVSSTNVEGVYGTHHINAYERNAENCTDDPAKESELCKENEPEVVVDVVIPPWYALKNFTDKQVLLNSKDIGSDSNLFKITRYTVNLESNTVSSADWEDFAPGEKPYYNQFDFPKTNPNYQGKDYCYAYGQALVDNVRQPLIKKNICDSAGDKVWFKENHYTGEPMFIPRPGASDEDDGVLLVIVLDGETEKSYLLLLDGKTFTTLTTAKLPDYIPMSVHGSWFDGEHL